MRRLLSAPLKGPGEQGPAAANRVLAEFGDVAGAREFRLRARQAVLGASSGRG